MNRLQIGLAEKKFEYPKGSLVITDERVLKRGEKLLTPPGTASTRSRCKTGKPVNLPPRSSPTKT